MAISINKSLRLVVELRNERGWEYEDYFNLTCIIESGLQNYDLDSSRREKIDRICKPLWDTKDDSAWDYYNRDNDLVAISRVDMPLIFVFSGFPDELLKRLKLMSLSIVCGKDHEVDRYSVEIPVFEEVFHMKWPTVEDGWHEDEIMEDPKSFSLDEFQWITM